MTVVTPTSPEGGAPVPVPVGQSLVPAIGTPWGRTCESGTGPKPSWRCTRSSRTCAAWNRKLSTDSSSVVTPSRMSAWPVPELEMITPSGLSVM